MRIYRQGCHVRVVVYWDEVDAFARRWPCSHFTSQGCSFTFDARNGDLVDSTAPESWDGGAVCALADDAKAFAGLR